VKEDLETGGEAAPKAKGSKALIGIAVLNLAIGAGVLGFLLLRPPAASHPDTASKAGAVSGEGHGKAAEGAAGESTVLIPLPNLVVNLADSDATHFLRMSVAFELKSEKLKEGFEAREPIVRDLAISASSGMTYEDLRAGSGREALRTELLAKVNQSLGESAGVKAVYFTEFVVQ
jgi:flagellar basal body-associated protein FliL